jgi:hypothetical protein
MTSKGKSAGAKPALVGKRDAGAVLPASGVFYVKHAETYTGRSANAIRLLERRGVIHGFRGPDGRLAFAREELDKLLGIAPTWN